MITYFKSFILFLAVLPAYSFAQNLPSYPVVLKEFINHYSYSQVEAVEGLNFAKKKDGWHVQVIDRVTEKVKQDKLFWSLKNNSYLPLSGFNSAPDKPEKDVFINDYLSGGLYNFFGYERCRYYGYSRWAEDMISDFGNRPLTNYSDTLIEGLGRAYSAYASKFLWYQYGGEAETGDSLKSKLGPLEKPSKARIDSINFYLHTTIEVFKALVARNNSYQTVVGNASMKVFNEQMNGYMQMSMAGYDDLARMYIDAIQPNSTYTAMARNYLDACPPNSILITFGDNDTYPLWYVQEKDNYRKDVAVLNTSLLGMSPYVDMVKRKGQVKFSSMSSVYGDRSFLYYLKNQDGPKITSLAEFLKTIQTKKYNEPSEIYGTLYGYSQEAITMNIDLLQFRSISEQKNLTHGISLKLRHYILNDEFIVLDIINTNLYSRPIFFSAGYDLLQSYLQNSGPIQQFLPLDTSKNELTQTIGFEKTKNYLKNKFVSVPYNDLSSGVSPASSFEDNAYSMYAFVAKNYMARNKPDSAAAFLLDLMKKYSNNPPFTLNLNVIGEAMVNSGNYTQGLKLLEDYSENMYSLYKNPSALKGYVSAKYLMQIYGSILDTLNDHGLESKKLNDLVARLASK